MWTSGGKTRSARALFERYWAVLLIASALIVPTFGPVAAVVTGLWIDRTWERMHRVPFDAAMWQATGAASEFESVRVYMIDDLLATHDLRGRSRADVVRSLGEPDSGEWATPREMVYWVGHSRARGGVYWLTVVLDTDGYVTQVALVQD